MVFTKDRWIVEQEDDLFWKKPTNHLPKCPYCFVVPRAVTESPVAPRPHQHVACSVSGSLPVLTGARWSLTVALVFIFLMTWHVELLLSCLLAICESSSLSYLLRFGPFLKSFCLFFCLFVSFSLSIERGFLCISDNGPLADVSFENSLSHAVPYLLILSHCLWQSRHFKF